MVQIPISKSEPGIIHSVKIRTPRKISDRQAKVPQNFLKNVNLLSPLIKTLGPITSSTIKFVLTGEFIHGTPFCTPEIMLTMRDGVKVAIDLYFPRIVYRNRLKCPTILIRTPYSKSQIPVIAHHFVQNGFVVVFQDVRGTSHSNKTGINTIFVLEREDAQDVIEWIKQQFWWNGKLGTWGASYLGLTQWAVYDSEDISAFYVQVASPRKLWAQHNGLGINELAVAFSRIVCDGAFFYGPMLQGKQERFHYWQYGQHYIHDPSKGMFNQPPGIEKIKLHDLAALEKSEMIESFNDLFGIDLHEDNPDKKVIQRLAMDLVFSNKISRYAEFFQGTSILIIARSSDRSSSFPGGMTCFLENPWRILPASWRRQVPMPENSPR